MEFSLGVGFLIEHLHSVREGPEFSVGNRFRDFRLELHLALRCIEAQGVVEGGLVAVVSEALGVPCFGEGVAQAPGVGSGVREVEAQGEVAFPVEKGGHEGVEQRELLFGSEAPAGEQGVQHGLRCEIGAVQEGGDALAHVFTVAELASARGPRGFAYQLFLGIDELLRQGAVAVQVAKNGRQHRRGFVQRTGRGEQGEGIALVVWPRGAVVVAEAYVPQRQSAAAEVALHALGNYLPEHICV